MRENFVYLLLSVALSAGRNITSKKTASDSYDNSQFYFSESVLFLSAALLLTLFNIRSFTAVSSLTLIYGAVYGVLLILSQFMFTLSLKSGNTSVCTVIYSLGFILPTVSGALFWNEEFTFLNFLGLILALAVILFTIKKDDNAGKGDKSFIPYILIAMAASGGLGIMQKVQQLSSVSNQKSEFLITAFVLSFLFSFTAYLFCRKKGKIEFKNIIYPSVTGICFGGANLCNTVLAGRMKSAVFFPVQNISTILLSTILGMIVFKEKLTLKTAVIIILGAAVVAVFSL